MLRIIVVSKICLQRQANEKIDDFFSHEGMGHCSFGYILAQLQIVLMSRDFITVNIEIVSY